jgi:PPK2 family polyphosphate:nucleotide phosphotransferase
MSIHMPRWGLLPTSRRSTARPDRANLGRLTQPEISAIHLVRGAGDLKSGDAALCHRVHQSAGEHPAGRASSIMSKKPSQSLVAELKPFVAPFRFDGSSEFHLKSQKTRERGGLDKAQGEEIIEANHKRLSDFQEKLYAQGRWSVLLIFQGMDAAGKDSAIKSVFEGINPQGCEVHSFKQPSTLELDHDFMWRSVIALPRRGRIGIFNRSHYEECLVVRVHPEILAQEKIPSRLVTRNIWRERFEDISSFERYLARNGTIILKFFLNISKEEQRERFLARLDEPSKNWKFSIADIAERALWEKYQAAYQEVIRHTSSEAAPWHVVPADHKWFARVVVGSTIVSALDKLDLQFPKIDPASLQEFKLVRKALLAEGHGRRGR